MPNTRALQIELRINGFDPGPVDGIMGRLTIKAIRAYQTAKKLTVDGLANAETLDSLFGAKSREAAKAKAAPPVWHAEALRHKGLREIAGKTHNDTILGWARKLGGWVASFYTNDEIPWCGLFVAHCIGSTLPAEPLPSNVLSALAWAKFGDPVSTPSVGTILVFKRQGGGHVGFYVGEDATAYHVLGGNQSNAVTITRIAKNRLVAMRQPATAPALTSGRVVLAGNGSLSKNEA